MPVQRHFQIDFDDKCTENFKENNLKENLTENEKKIIFRKKNSLSLKKKKLLFQHLNLSRKKTKKKNIAFNVQSYTFHSSNFNE